MPLVRIDVRKGKDAAYRQEIGRIVYEALVGVGVPKNDRFQVISEYDANSFVFDGFCSMPGRETMALPPFQGGPFFFVSIPGVETPG